MKKKTETCKNSFSFSNNDVPCFRRVQGLVQVDLKTNASCITPAQTSLNSDSFVPLIPPCLVFFFCDSLCRYHASKCILWHKPVSRACTRAWRVSFKHQLSLSSKSTEQAAPRIETLTLGTGVCYEWKRCYSAWNWYPSNILSFSLFDV